jgi:hypothetical protein
VSVAGLGSLVGSLADLIGYKLYLDHHSTHDRLSFTIHFLLIGFAAFLICVALLLVIQRVG